MRGWTVLLMVTVAWAGDRDGDGLPDFEERHKYGTDPDKRDSDGDGTPDGDWNERREFAYTLRTVIRVMPPAEAVCDIHQDARVRLETKSFVELEVIHYPLQTSADALEGRSNGRAHAAAQKEFLVSSPTSGFDAGMRRQLLRELEEAGIDPAASSDATLVRAAAARLLDRAEYHRGFTTFFVEFEDGRPRIADGLTEAAGRNRVAEWSFEQQWRRELFAQGMFETRSHGSCTSTAIYLAGGLRAVGIPARLVYTVPAIDASDPGEWKMLDRIRHHRVRQTIRRALARGRQAWSSHTLNEVYVGGRWWWLNYKQLGQSSLDAHYFGLLTSVLVLRDWADAHMARTVGRRQGGKPAKDDPFGYRNPYSTVELSDEFGAHARIENPTVEEFRKLTIERAIWYADPERPAGVTLRLQDPERAGHVLLKVAENRDGSRAQYETFWECVDRRFLLRAKGRPDVEARADRGYWGSGWFYLRIDPEPFRTMKPGVAYELVPANGESEFRWVAKGVKLTR